MSWNPALCSSRETNVAVQTNGDEGFVPTDWAGQTQLEGLCFHLDFDPDASSQSWNFEGGLEKTKTWIRRRWIAMYWEDRRLFRHISLSINRVAVPLRTKTSISQWKSAPDRDSQPARHLRRNRLSSPVHRKKQSCYRENTTRHVGNGL